MDNFYLDIFSSQEKAIHHCLWLNFKYRIAKITFGIINGPDNNFAVVEEATAKEMEMSFLDILPKDYSDMNYDDIRKIRMDEESAPHLEELFAQFTTMDGEILRFILQSKIPIEKIIRFTLAERGFDKNHHWCGFSKSFEIWLK
ncbi:hypothetical protein [uncultured Polaribacter sp.]|uniref:hypothetical protein n=1 Tax=uncultured Polaribacter sp. TaxID=174711 RepID=UPI00260ED5F8|nr:hypothetical protein [uncultured Polaribacter sp.]